MYKNVKFILCNGQNITYQQPTGYREVKTDLNEVDPKQRMERNELSLSFHNLIKRGSVCELL